MVGDEILQRWMVQASTALVKQIVKVLRRDVDGEVQAATLYTE